MPRALRPGPEVRAAMQLRLVLALAALALAPLAASAQGIRPGDQRLQPPPPRKPRQRAPLELPPLHEPGPEAPGRLSQGLRVHVSAFEVTGSSVFSAAELAAATAPFTGRAISSEELLAARDAVTRLYVDHGYLTSGAVIPDQDVAGGVVRLQVVEGALAEVEVRGNRWFRDAYFRTRLLRAGRAPLDVKALEAELQRLQRDPYVRRVAASLEPGARRGESRLVVTVEEARPYALGLEFANDRSPAVGSYGPTAQASMANLLGLRDVLSARGELTEGLWDVEAHYDLPLPPWDTRVGVGFRETQSRIVEPPFQELDIHASARSYMLSLFQPVWRSELDDVELGFVAERRQSDATLLGAPFCFQANTSVCNPVATVLRASAAWTRRTQRDVLALRSQLSFGIDALGATVSGDPRVPDGDFFAWLGQAQWLHVLPESWLASLVVLRADAQLTDGPLLSIEQFAVGGRYTVRGYRENQLVRDNGVVLSAELRVPVWRNALGRHIVDVVPFVDWGHAWNDRDPQPIRSLTSVGLGLRVAPTPWLWGELFWGARLRDVPNDWRSPQDYGFHFRIGAHVL